MIIKTFVLLEDRTIICRLRGRTFTKVIPAGTEFELPSDVDPGPNAELIERKWRGDEDQRMRA